MHDSYNKIFQQLNSSDIRYCSWKNNHLLNQSLNGIGDIDLLVDINQLNEFETLLSSHNFVEFCVPRPPTRCIRHYYYAREQDDFILHIHVYYRIITGESQFKNYHFPFEKALLDSCYMNDFGIAEANPHHQLQIYSLRRLVKISSIPSLFSAIRDRKDSREEIEYIQTIAQGTAAVPAQDLGAAWVKRLQSGRHKLITGLRLRRNIKAYRLKTGLPSLLGSYIGISELVLRRVLRRKGKRCTGLIVSIVGLDGSGKSSSIDYLTNYYKTVLAVKKVHFGRPSPTILTFPLKIAIDIYKRFSKSKKSEPSLASNKDTGVIQAIRLAALARDRYHAMAKSNQYRGMGYLVLMDRCPVKTFGCMDAPKIKYSGKSKLMNWLRNVESDFYRKMPTVDHALFLKTSVESAIARNDARTKTGKETAEDIKERFRVNEHAEFSAEKLHVIDTEHDLLTVRKEVKRCFWNIISSVN